MKPLRIFGLGLLFLAPAGAWAGDAEEEFEDPTFTGGAVESVVEDIEDEKAMLEASAQVSETIRPYPDKVYEGARVLNMDVKFVNACHEAIELIFERKYSEAKTAFEDIQKRYPGTALAPVGKVMVYQALMLENLDFRYEKQYELASNHARQQLMQALEVRGNDAWENFILGGILGIDAIHSMRRGNYLTSLGRALEAMKAVGRAKELAPEFPDLLLGDGLYNYWRTVISRTTRGLPDFADNRLLGIEQLRTVQENGVFLAPAATFALTFTWIEEGARKRATAEALRNHRDYPNNVVNNLQLGRLYMYRRNYVESERFFNMVIASSKENRRAHYYLTRMLLRQKRLADAELHVNRYLAFKLSNRERSNALMLKCMIYYRRKDWDTAERLAQEAWKIGKLKRAKNRLAKISKARVRDAKRK
jgi:tetratricopeptide (TPR) repeat protein